MSPTPASAYHPWYPVLTIGGDKAALYTAALVADIVGKEYHLTDPAWLLRVGVYLELLTCIGIFEAVRDDVGDLLDARRASGIRDERGLRRDPASASIPTAWREVWGMRRITFPGFGSPRTGPVSALNLMRKRDATLRFLHVHHEDLKHAIELAGPNHVNSQETWQRVFRDAERAVMRQAGRRVPRAGLPARAGAGGGALAAARLRRPAGPLPDGLQPVPGVDERGRRLGQGPRADGPRRARVRAARGEPAGGARRATRRGSRCCSARTASDLASR